MDLQRFRVYTTVAAGTPPAEAHDTLDLTIIPADRMRAERASTAELPPHQRGPEASKSHPNTWVLLWLWCAATRVGDTSAKFPDWAATVLDFDPLDAHGNVRGTDPDTGDATGEAPALDPTNGAALTT
jgi:hypothetical protein